jgi:hypothetical protein
MYTHTYALYIYGYIHSRYTLKHSYLETYAHRQTRDWTQTHTCAYLTHTHTYFHETITHALHHFIQAHTCIDIHLHTSMEQRTHTSLDTDS